MARKRVIAYFMHGPEMARLLPHLANCVVTQSFAVGDIEEGATSHLEKGGIFFEEVEAWPPPALHDPTARACVIAALAEAERSSDSAATASTVGSYYLMLGGPLLAEWRAKLEELGVRFRLALPNFCWLVRIDRAKLDQVRRLSFVTNVAEARAPDPSSAAETAARQSADDERRMVPFNVRLLPEASLPEFLEWLHRHDIPVATAEVEKVQIYLQIDDPRLDEVAQLTDWVADIRLFPQPESRLAAACAESARQYYAQQRNHAPSTALIKATLINSTGWLTEPVPAADRAAPNHHFGEGRVYLPLGIPNYLVPELRLEFYDNRKSVAGHLSVTGDRRRFSVHLAAGGWLRVALAYIDPPGRALQNTLDLFLQLPDESKLSGKRNAEGPRRPGLANQFELLSINHAPPGEYLIEVVATSLLQPQDFAIVATGKLTTPLIEI